MATASRGGLRSFPSSILSLALVSRLICGDATAFELVLPDQTSLPSADLVASIAAGAALVGNTTHPELGWQNELALDETVKIQGSAQAIHQQGLEGYHVEFLLGCTAAAYRLAAGNETAYLLLASPCAVQSIVGLYPEVRFVFHVRRLWREAAAQISDLVTYAADCYRSQGDDIMERCVPLAWREGAASLEARVTSQSGFRLLAYIKVLCLSISATTWAFVLVFLWNARSPLLWIFVTFVVGIFTLCLALYQAGMLFFDMVVYATVRGYSMILRSVWLCFQSNDDREAALQLRKMAEAKTFEEWHSLATSFKVNAAAAEASSDAKSEDGRACCVSEVCSEDGKQEAAAAAAEANDESRRRGATAECQVEAANAGPLISESPVMEVEAAEESTTPAAAATTATVGTSSTATPLSRSSSSSSMSYASKRTLSQSMLSFWRGEDLPHQSDDDLLRENIWSLQEMMQANNIGRLLINLRGQLTRNHAGTNRVIEGPGRLMTPRKLVRDYVESLCRALDFLAASKDLPIADRLTFFRECQRSYGHTALCLSGGGSLAMYHMGICKELLQQGLLPNVISGTSGGSIVVAFLALHSDEELLNDCFVEDISTRYPQRFFPPLWREMLLFAHKGVLVGQEEFAETTARYFGDTTFAEAYAKTGRNCSITISTHSSQHRTGAGLLLNRLTTPDVTVASAVCASCALPGIMGPHVLYAKMPGGELVPFDAGGKHFVDGTLHADLPKQRLAEMFHCNQFVISQVNPHIAPFVRRTEARCFGAKTIAEHRQPFEARTAGVLRQIEDWMSMDIRHRVQVLSKFGLMPTLYGLDLGPVFRQSYAEFRRGVMLVPDCIGIADTPRAIKNPTVKDMRHFLFQGQRCVWPKVDHLRHLLQLERQLETCLQRLESQVETQP